MDERSARLQIGKSASPGLPNLGLPRPWKKSEVIARDIIRGIVEEELPPSAPLPAEAEMARRYGVGRASVREALRLLESQGLIEIRQGHQGGPSVGAADSGRLGSMITLYFQLARVTYEAVGQCLLALESMMAGFAATNVGQHEPLLTSLNDCVGFCDHAHPANEVSGKLGDFHRIIGEMAGNEPLRLLALAIGRIYLDHIVPLVDLTRFHESAAAEHHGIALAIGDGDADRAADLMREHTRHMLTHARDQAPGVLEQTVHWR